MEWYFSKSEVWEFCFLAFLKHRKVHALIRVVQPCTKSAGSLLRRMSMKRLSPTANLLRTSRLFSLPPPLPKASADLNAIGNPETNTTTLPYPIHAAIETSESALSRGDWGLKRPLPLKSTTRSSSPYITIENVDSIDHITDFDSAGDHIKTLEKWQEMDLSLSRHGQNETEALQSVFEPSYDNTASSIFDSEQERWKFKGPWLGGQSQGEFSEFVERKIKKRRSEFREYMREILSQETLAAQRRKLIENGPGESPTSLSPSRGSSSNSIKISDEDLDTFIRKLRRNPDGLDKYILTFLDLPRESRPQKASAEYKEVKDIGPPSTHPSAGLSYLRSHSHTVNNPFYGPQGNKSPVQARVLLPQRDPRGFNRPRAIFGIGGVASQDSKVTFTKSGEEDALAAFNPDVPGGGKVWLQLRKATIDPQSRIQIGNQRAERNALIAAGVDPGITPPVTLPEAARVGSSRTMPDLSPRPSHNRSTHGYGLEDLGDVPKRERVEPFEDENDVLSIMKQSLQQGSQKRS